MSRCEAPGWKIETHKYEDAVGIRFPVLNHLLVLFRRHLKIHRENRSGAIDEVRYAERCLILRRLWWVLVATYLRGDMVRTAVVEQCRSNTYYLLLYWVHR